MARFRKKPVVIEAFQIQPEDSYTRRLPPSWLIDAMRAGTVAASDDGKLEIKTLEGTMRADIGDWVIQGVKGELYPCKPEIFAATYEEVV